MEIKTIKYRLDNAEHFDKAVNQALADGWILDKRYISNSSNTDSFRMLIAELYRDPAKKLEIKVKYFTDIDQEFKELEKVAVGDWIDLRLAEDIDIKKGEYKLLRLGVGMILPDGYEAIVAPRSSTPKNFGILMANSIGIIDNSYSGDGDEWKFPAIGLKDIELDRGSRIAQFRIIKNMDPLEITRTYHLNNNSRGGVGSTGKR